MAFRKNHIVVAGAGFGGVRATLDLIRYLPDDVITLINEVAYHCFRPDLYEVATAQLGKERKIDFKNLSGTVNIPLKEIIRSKNSQVFVAKIIEVDLVNHSVTTDSGKFFYDFLVLALGSTTHYFDIEGGESYSHPLKSTADAINIRNDLEELFQQPTRPLSVVIAGGGFTGVELLGALSNFLPKSAQIIVVEGGDSLLSGMPEWAQLKALDRLKDLGINILTNHLIKKVDSQKIYCTNGTELLYDYLIWVAGIKGEGLSDQIEGVELTNRKKIQTQPDLSISKYPEVFVVGDLVEIIDQKNNLSVPATAWAAIGQAKVAAENIKHKLKRKTTRRYFPPNPAFVVPIGSKYALTNAFGLKSSGISVWILKRLLSLKYLLTILPPIKAFKIWWQSVEIYSKND